MIKFNLNFRIKVILTFLINLKKQKILFKKLSNFNKIKYKYFTNFNHFNYIFFNNKIKYIFKYKSLLNYLALKDKMVKQSKFKNYKYFIQINKKKKLIKINCKNNFTPYKFLKNFFFLKNHKIKNKFFSIKHSFFSLYTEFNNFKYNFYRKPFNEFLYKKLNISPKIHKSNEHKVDDLITFNVIFKNTFGGSCIICKYNNIKNTRNNFFLFKTFKGFILTKKFKLSSKKLNLNFLIKNILHTNDFFSLNNNYSNSKGCLNFFSNKYLMNYFSVININWHSKSNNYNLGKMIKKEFMFNNYYPVYNNKDMLYIHFFNKFKVNRNLNYLHLNNKLLLNFLETLFKKNFYIKISNNLFKNFKNFYLEIILNEYKNFRPQYFKTFLFSDFIKILWYSFLFKDLKMLSEWVSVFMETLNFKNHKKFINLFQNFLIKYAEFFISVLNIKGFFFDIRGKVGVTGSSKKRHLCFKFGSLNKSSKNFKINFNQNLVRTYSGVLGLTYILCY